MNSPMSGTSIQDLRRNESIEPFNDINRLNDMRYSQYGAMENLQYEQGHNAAHAVQQAQHQQYYNMENNYDYPQWLPKPPQEVPPMGMQPVAPTVQTAIPEEAVTEEPDMENLAIDISNSLPIDAFPIEVSDVPESTSSGNGGYLSFIPEMLREPLIIVILFVILSEGTVKDTIGNYISQLNPDFTGRVSRVGVVIYGLLLATLFVVVKKFLLK